MKYNGLKFQGVDIMAYYKTKKIVLWNMKN